MATINFEGVKYRAEKKVACRCGRTTMDDIRKVIAEMRERKVNHGKYTSPTLEAWADRLEAALSRPAGGECSAPAGWKIEVDGEHVEVTKPNGAVSEWFHRPATNGSGMYDLCRDLAAAPTPHGGEDARDAERYRFLRRKEAWKENYLSRDGGVSAVFISDGRVGHATWGADLDSAIDAAIAASREVG